MDRYAVIGNPVAHSLSPRIHAAFAQQTAQDMVYERIQAPVDQFAEVAGAFFEQGGCGLNVTTPFKLDAASWVDELDPLAEFAGAVNTIVPITKGQRRGYNTDGPGLINDLKRLLGERHKLRILLLGAGGAARGVARPLAQELSSSLLIANRTPARARSICDDLASVLPELPLAGCSLDAITGEFDLVINATSAGLSSEVPGIDPRLVSGAFCYDMVYGGDTTFCIWAREAGAAEVADGLGMLIEQAALAFALWRGELPDTRPIFAALTMEASSKRPPSKRPPSKKAPSPTDSVGR